MKNYRVALRYAQALLQSAEQMGKLDEIRRDLFETTPLLERYPEIPYLLMNTTIAREEKEDFLEKILPEETSNLLLNFIKVLIKKRRFQDLGLIAETFQRLYDEKKGIRHVKVTAPIALDERLEEKIKAALEKKLGGQVSLETAVRPELIGGMVLDFDGSQIDGSFKTALYEIKQRLTA